MKVLVVDIGGTQIKLGVEETSARAHIESSADLTPDKATDRILQETAGWSYDVIAIGYPGCVGANGPLEEPGNLGNGWVGFEYENAFGRPVRVINDAVMQALGAYDGGRMLFLGLGTGIGSALVTDQVAIPLELGELPYGDKSFMTTFGKKALEESGEELWRERLLGVLPALKRSFIADYIVVGGGNAARVAPLPESVREGSNDDAIKGGTRLWREEVDPHERISQPFWRVVG